MKGLWATAPLMAIGLGLSALGDHAMGEAGEAGESAAKYELVCTEDQVSSGAAADFLELSNLAVVEFCGDNDLETNKNARDVWYWVAGVSFIGAGASLATAGLAATSEFVKIRPRR